MGLAKGNIYDEVENLFESVYRIYEQRHSQVDYKFIIIFFHFNLQSLQTKLFIYVNQTKVTSNAPTPSNPSSRGRSIISHLKNIISKINDAPSPTTPTMTSTEIQLYKSSVANHTNINLDDENFSILQYWHQVKDVFPILSSMALDIFAVLVSTIASESYFSAANRVLTDKRTGLGPDVFETLVLLKD
jgi:hAT family C-terminal dimerisation region